MFGRPTPALATDTVPAADTLRRRRGGENTRDSFLDAAERLFGERGYDATSIRAIAEAAGANLGALHYYWGSKEALLEETCERCLRPVAEERIRRLDECLAQAGGNAPTLEAVLRAFLEPALLRPDDTEERLQTVGRLLHCLAGSAAPEVQRIRSALTDETSMRLIRLLRMACPALDDETFHWRLNAVFGSLQYALSSGERMRRLTHGRFTGQDRARGVQELVAGLHALLNAPSAVPPPRKKK